MKHSSYDKTLLLDMYRDMVRIRRFEEKAADCFTKGKLAGNIHLCIGQEGSAVGTSYALDQNDYMTATHRGHGQLIGKGAKTDRMLAELFGKKTGYCFGKGGSMHVAEVENLHILGANGIVGGGIPIATGSALATKIRGGDEITLAFFGDSASNQGTFHESINMAAAWKLPVLYLCENNGYGVSVDIHSVTNTDTISVRAKAYDIPGKTVDGLDVLEVYEAVKEAAEYVRSGKGPYLLEIRVYRWQGHYCGDPAVYRPKTYLEEAHEKDPIVFFRKELLKQKTATAEELESVEEAMAQEIEDAYEFADSSPYPDVKEAVTDVYSSDNERSVAR